MPTRGAIMFGLLIATGVTHAQGLVPATEPYQEWLEAACIMQPWSGERVSAMIEDRATWIPRLKDWGVTAVIFIPGPGDIRPHYPLEVMRAAIDDYHAAGIKVIMYWSIMHVGHHESWHTVAQERPEWWQRDAEGGTVTVYGDKWLCPNTGALDYTIELGIELAQAWDADGIMLDNNEFYYTDVGATCYCEGCQTAFRAHIRAKLGDQALRALGVEPQTVRCPLPEEALWPHWVDWRYLAWRDATAQFRGRVRAALPGTMLCANTQYKYNWVLAVQEQIEGEDLLFSESRNQLGREMSAKLAYGHCLADGKPVWNYLGTWQDDDASRLQTPAQILDQLCTSLAWNTAPWIVGYGLIFQSPAQWWVQGRYTVPEGATWTRTEGAGPDGSVAVALSSPGTARISITHQPFIAVEPGQRFRFAIRYRTQDVQGGAPRVRITFVDANHRAPVGTPYVFYAEGEGGTHDWQELRLNDIVAPEGAAVVNIEPFLWDASGTVWYDDVRFERDGQNLVRNGGFEMPAGAIDAEARDTLVGGLQFLRAHADLYRGATRWADVGLLLSRHSVDFAAAYNRFPRPTINALLDAHIPFAILEEHQLDAEHLGRFRVLVAPQATCLADRHLEALAAWVRGGGRLIFTGATGEFTQYHEEREGDLPAELLDHPRAAMTEPVEVGKGRAQWLPQGDANREVAPGLIEAIRALGGGQTVRVEGASDGLDLVAWAQAEERRLLLHLDRHEAGTLSTSRAGSPTYAVSDEAGAGGEVTLRLALPEGWASPTRVTVHDLQTGTREVPATCTAGAVAFTVPAPEWYAVVAIE